MKYIFKQIDNISGSNAVTTIEFDADYLPDILEHFEMFLRGSGFLPSGTLDFVNDSWEDDCPQFEPAEEHYEEETHEWYKDKMADSEWPFPHEKPDAWVADVGEKPTEDEKQEWQGVAPSVAMQWTVNELMKGKPESIYEDGYESPSGGLRA